MRNARMSGRNTCRILALAGLVACAPPANAQKAALKPITVNPTLRQTIPTSGYAANVLLKGKNLIVSISPFREADPAGLEVFGLNSATGEYEGSCSSLLTFPAADKVTSVMGIQFLDKRRTRIGAAVECAGAEIAYLGNPASCAFQAPPINVPQPSVPNCSGKAPPGTIDLAVSPNSQFAFLANEYGTLAGMPEVPDRDGTVGVIPLRDPGNPGYSVYVPGAGALAGVTISKDGKRLYVTSESATTNRRCGPTLSEPCNNPTNLPPESELLRESGCLQRTLGVTGLPNGLLTVFDVQKLKQGKAQGALVTSIAAGCSPVRIVESRDGKTIWVTARGDNKVQAFSVAKLMSKDPNTVNASYLGGVASGGTAPVGMTLFNKGRLLAVVNSNRFNYLDGVSSLAIFDARGRSLQLLGVLVIPLKREIIVPPNHHHITPLVDGYYSAFPRNIVAGPDNTLYVTNFVTGEVLVVDPNITQGP